MTVSDLFPPTPYETARQYGLVMAARAAEALLALQASHDNKVCAVIPVPLADGRFALCADILTEIAPGGLFYDTWTRFDFEKFASDFEVVEWAAFPDQLLPQASEKTDWQSSGQI